MPAVRETTATIEQAGERRRASIESLRAIAALGVMIAHAWGYAQGYGGAAFDSLVGKLVFGGGLGVFLFFALSGYLLFWPFAKHHFGGGRRLSLRQYGLNRALRILPLYYVSVITLLVLQEGGGTFVQWWRFMLFAETLWQDTMIDVNGVLWSLVVELHFYLLLPLLALGLARAAGSSRLRAAAVLVALGGASLAVWLQLGGDAGAGQRQWRLTIPGTFFYFVPGMLLALVRLHWEERPPTWLRGAAGRSDLWILAAAAITLFVMFDYRRAPLITVAAFLVVGACVLPLRRGVLLGVLDWRALSAIGVVSYSLYVWHFPLQDALAGLDGFPATTAGMLGIAAPLCVLAAFLSYRFIEAPFLRLRRRWADSSPPVDPAPAQPAPVAERAPA